MGKKLYAKGKYPLGDYTCGKRNQMLQSVCIIDNDHPGRPHWGPDISGNFVQWPIVFKVFKKEDTCADQAGPKGRPT